MEEFRIDMRKPEEADPEEGIRRTVMFQNQSYDALYRRIRCFGERVVHGQYR